MTNKRLKFVSGFSALADDDSDSESVESGSSTSAKEAGSQVSKNDIDFVINVLNALSQNIPYFRQPELRLLRSTMQPLINEQKSSDNHGL